MMSALSALLGVVSLAQAEEEKKLVYQIQYPKDFKGDRKEVLEKTRVRVRWRINRAGLKEPTVSTLDDDKVVIRVALQKAEELKPYKELCGRQGRLELRVVASAKIQDQWKKDPSGAPPAGWLPFKMKDGGETVLCAEETVITGADVQNASTSISTEDKNLVRWKVDFQLTDAGAKKFDKAAEKLYNVEESLRGSIAILFDGEILSAPRVNSSAFHGAGEISGNFDKRGVEQLAFFLRSGELPFPVKLVEEK